MKILIREANWLGDVVLTIPSLKAIHNKFPEWRMTIVAKKSLLPLFNLLPWKIEAIPLGGAISWLRLGREKFDFAVIFPNSFRSGLEVFLCRAKRRIGYSTYGRGRLLTDRIPLCKNKIHQARYYYNILQVFDIKDNMPDLKLTVKEEDKSLAAAYLKDMGVDLDRPLVAISPGASYGVAKCWPVENFAALLDMVAREAEIILIGKDTDIPIIEKIVSASKARVFSLAGRTSILELAAIFSISRLLISNDNGAMHLAAALGIDVICIFGPTDPDRTRPLGNKATVLRDKVYCSPCTKRTCYDRICFNTITVDRVYNTVRNIL